MKSFLFFIIIFSFFQSQKNIQHLVPKFVMINKKWNQSMATSTSQFCITILFFCVKLVMLMKLNWDFLNMLTKLEGFLILCIIPKILNHPKPTNRQNLENVIYSAVLDCRYQSYNICVYMPSSKTLILKR